MCLWRILPFHPKKCPRVKEFENTSSRKLFQAFPFRLTLAARTLNFSGRFIRYLLLDEETVGRTRHQQQPVVPDVRFCGGICVEKRTSGGCLKLNNMINVRPSLLDAPDLTLGEKRDAGAARSLASSVLDLFELNWWNLLAYS